MIVEDLLWYEACSVCCYSILYMTGCCIVSFFRTKQILPHPFNGLFSWTTWVSQHQKGNPFWILMKQWHQRDLTSTSLQTNNHASTPPLSFYRPDALPATQPTASKHWRQLFVQSNYNYYNCFTALWISSRTTWVSQYQKKHLPTHTSHGHPLSAFSIYYNPWHPSCSKQIN